MRLAILVFLSLVSAGSVNAQAASCKDVAVHDALMPVYAPIARAARVEGTVRFTVDLSPELRAEVKLIGGPKMLEAAAQKYIEDRQYYWNSEGTHTSCSYKAEVEYRILPSESDEANNFYRVTALGMGHTLVEAQLIKPTCSDCFNETCRLDGLNESKTPVYPPIARAAHIEGDVTARVTFDKSGKPIAVDQFAGPAMLKTSTEEYLRSWTIQKLPQWMDKCYASIFLSYQLQRALESNPPEITFYKADDTHILIEAHGVMQVDPTAVVSRGKKH